MNKAARTRQYIIEQVAPIFNKQGYAGTALSDIEIATGLTKGAIYGNFGNKDGLAIACFEYNIRPLQKGLIRALASPGTCVDKLKASINFYRTHFEEVAQSGGCPLMNTSVEADDTLPFLKKRVQESVLSWQGDISALLTNGQQAREIKNEINVRQYSVSIIAMIEGGILLAKAMDEANYFYKVLDTIEWTIERDLKISK
ncbi:MAG: TetR family transcriptional regulator [Roseivirga sp.]|nr:TetR family transcriptional regulator [Roseivirga sp.]